MLAEPTVNVPAKVTAGPLTLLLVTAPNAVELDLNCNSVPAPAGAVGATQPANVPSVFQLGT